MESLHLIRKKVYDPMLRLIHLVLALACIALIFTGFLAWSREPGPRTAELWDLHTSTGFIFFLALFARFLWFFLGPASAQWKELIHCGIWKKSLKNRRLPGLQISFGHDPMASIAYLGFYTMAGVITFTGFFLAGIEHARGPLADMFFDSVWLTEFFAVPHLIMAFGITGFFIVHLAGMIYHEKKYKQPTVQAMISGYQYRPEEKDLDI